MPVELKVPEVGESITEVQISQWRKGVGDWAKKDENLVEIESDKATVELPAPVSGTIVQILKQPGQPAHVGEIIGYMNETSAAPTVAPQANSPPPAERAKETSPKSAERASHADQPSRIMPAAERLMAQEGICSDSVAPTGPGGRTLKEDVQRAVENRKASSTQSSSAPTSEFTPSPTREIVPADLSRKQPPMESQSTGLPARKSMS